MTGLSLYTFKREFLILSIDLQIALATDAHLAEGATERGKVTYVPSRAQLCGCYYYYYYYYSR
jgi:hypothetical protein